MSILRDTLFKTGDEKNYVWTKVAPNPSRIHKTTTNTILCKNLMFVFSLIPSFSRYCRSKNDHARLSCRISFMKTCSPYASVSANLSKICTFLWPSSVAKNAVQGSQPPISSSVLNNGSLKIQVSEALQNLPPCASFWRRLWLQKLVENFLCVVRIRSEYVKHSSNQGNIANFDS